jgi:spore coat protein U-like protein
MLAGVSVVLSAAAATVVTGAPQTPTLDKCLFRSVSDVAFGEYNGATKDVIMTIDYICGSAAKEIYIMLDTGPDRRMLGPRPATTSDIAYELYQRGSGGALSVWTNSMSQTTAYYMKDPKDQTVISVDVIGRVAAGYSVPSGSYFDDLVVRLDWDPNGAVGVQEITQSVKVTAGLTSACTVTTTDLAFGSYDPLILNSGGAGSDLDAQATITVTCQAGAAPIVWITPDTAGRVMTGPGNLVYELYSDAARTAVWGSNASTGFKLPVSGGAAQQLMVYGRVPRGQNVSVGAYSQMVTVTVNF